MIPLLTFVQTRDPGRKLLRNRRTAPKPHLPTCAALTLLFFSLGIHIPVYAQAPVFAGVPDKVIHTIIPAHPEMPAQTSFDIAVIETNAPDYFASSDKGYRYGRVEGLIAIEEEQLKGSPDLQRYWYEFLEAKGPALTESEIDAIAREWWSDNGYQAEERFERGGSKKASLSEVRARFQIFRTGNEAQIRAARNWLMMAQMGDHWEHFRLPPQMQGMSPLAHLLARDIAKEALIYTGEEGEKLRRTVRSLLADKFMVEGDAGIAHIVSSSDVDAVLDDLLSDNEGGKRSAQESLEEWLRRAIDTDLKTFANGGVNSHRPH
ncbi:MAG TPA: hypothetical protein VGF82_25655 [Terracidiphilus sp.]|jgi:hypothetical protein